VRTKKKRGLVEKVSPEGGQVEVRYEKEEEGGTWTVRKHGLVGKRKYIGPIDASEGARGKAPARPSA